MLYQLSNHGQGSRQQLWHSAVEEPTPHHPEIVGLNPTGCKPFSSSFSLPFITKQVTQGGATLLGFPLKKCFSSGVTTTLFVHANTKYKYVQDFESMRQDDANSHHVGRNLIE